MAASIPTFEPKTFSAGDSVDWLKSVADYPPGDGWNLTYCFRGNKLSAVDVTTTASNGAHLAVISATTSAGLIPGEYSVVGYAVNTDARVQIFAGKIVVAQNFQTMEAGVDTRTIARRTLDNIEAVIEGRASSSILSSSVDGTSISRLMPDQLLAFRDHYKQIVANEEARELLAQGKRPDRRILSRFSNP